MFQWLHRWMDNERRDRERRIARLLNFAGELSSYQIAKMADLRADSLYATLMRMERNGRLTSRWGQATAERGWRRPRLYRLSE